MSAFEINYRYQSGDNDTKRNITVTHKVTKIKITSPDFTLEEKSDDELKKEVWEVMKTAMKIWKID